MIVSKISDMKELFMKKLLLVFFFIFLAITVFPIEPVKIVAEGLKTLEIDYWLDTYFDFATGESFTEKRDGKSNELIWRKQNEKAYQVKRQYEKYQLSYPEPVIVLLTRKGYSFEWWDIERHSHGWKFWKWDWYILRDRCVSRTSPVYWVSDLIQVVLDQCNPSKEEAQRIYAETIRLIREKNDKSVDLFLQDSYVKFHAEEFRKELTGYLNGGEKLPDTRHLRLMEWERNRYPDVLPKHFYTDVFRNTSECAAYAEFFLAEFERKPTPLNAVMLALTIQNPEPFFKTLHEKKKLDIFVKLTYPEKLPPLPPPCPSCIPFTYASGFDCPFYTEEEYLDLPYREQLLQWRCFNGRLYKHCRTILEKEMKTISAKQATTS